MDTFFQTNKTKLVSYSLFWGTVKAYLRSQNICSTWHAIWERKKETWALTQSFLDRQYSEAPTAGLIYKQNSVFYQQTDQNN